MKRKGVSTDGHAAPKASDELTGRPPAHEHINGTAHSELLRYAAEKLSERRVAHLVGDIYAKFDAFGTLLREDKRLFDALDILSKGGDAKELRDLGRQAGLDPRLCELLPLMFAKAEAKTMVRLISPLIGLDFDARILRKLYDKDTLFRRKFEELIEANEGEGYRHPDKRLNLISALELAGLASRDEADAFLRKLEGDYRAMREMPPKK